MPLREIAPGINPNTNERAKVDIVAVHGLNPVNRENTEDHAWNTWRKPGTADGNLWLKDKLPEVAPNARVFLYVYNSNPVFGASKERLVHQADDLLEILHIKRTKDPRRPIIFVGHSLGGILIKQVLVNAHNNRRYTAIRESTFGLVFFGTPHDGGNDALVKIGKTSMAIVRGIFREPPNDLMQALSHGSLFADVLQANWRNQLNLYKIVSFYEKEDEHHVRIVPRASAVIGLPGDMENQVGIDASHSEICRFDPSILTDMDNYEKVQGNFRELYEGALEKQGEILPSVPEENDEQRHILSSQPPSQLQAYYEVPNHRVRSFKGREDILTRINKVLSTGRSPRIAVLQGMGGQGKSQVALEYCSRKKNSPYSAIFWVDATTESTAAASFESIYECIKTLRDHQPDSRARVSFVLRAFTSRLTSWFIVFDNYDNPDVFPNIQDFIPDGEFGAILVTSRHADASALVIEQSTNFIELPGLEKDAALDLLIEQSQIKEFTIEDAEKIIERLGYHPLAITQAGAYIRKRKFALHKFLDYYKDRKELILKNTPQLSQYRKKLGIAEVETSLNVFTTWELSFQQLQAQHTEDSIDIRVLTISAFFNHKDISERFFAEYVGSKPSIKTAKLLGWLKGFTNDKCQWDSDLYRDVLIKLKDLSLLQTFEQEPDGFYHSSLHPLVKDWIQLRIANDTYKENTLAAASLLGQVMATSWHHRGFDLSLSAKQSILLHVIVQVENHKTLLQLQPKEPLSPSELHEYLGAQSWSAMLLSDMGSFESAAMINERVMAERETALGLEHPDTLVSKSNLASTYSTQERWTEAEKLQMQVMETCKRVLGEEHPATLISMSNLAFAYNNQGWRTEAEKLVVQVMETSKRVLGEEHPETLISIGNLALTYGNQGRWPEAEKLEVQVMKTRKRVLGEEHPDTLISIGNLALTYGNQGRWPEAEKLEVQVMKTRKRVLGDEHLDTLTSMANLAHTYKHESRNDEAIKLMKDAVDGLARTIGASHPNTVGAARTLGTWTSI